MEKTKNRKRRGKDRKEREPFNSVVQRLYALSLKNTDMEKIVGKTREIFVEAALEYLKNTKKIIDYFKSEKFDKLDLCGKDFIVSAVVRDKIQSLSVSVVGPKMKQRERKKYPNIDIIIQVFFMSDTVESVARRIEYAIKNLSNN